MFGLGMGEILFILVLALLVIGPKKLPQLAKNLGKGLREFQKAKDGIMKDIEKEEEGFQTTLQAEKEALDAEYTSSHEESGEELEQTEKKNSKIENSEKK